MSLRDQLLKAGLVNEKQAKQAVRQKQKQQRLQKKGQVAVDDSQQQAILKARAEKQERDQELNRQQQEKAEHKAKQAQIKQLIETSRLPRLEGDDYYNFADQNKIKRIAVNPALRNQLSTGQLGIVRHAGGYEIVPREVALKIQARDAFCLVALNELVEETDENDPYAAYKIPDDLMW